MVWIEWRGIATHHACWSISVFTVLVCEHVLGQISQKRLERLVFNGRPIGNCIRRIEWSRDRWRHLTLNGQGRDPIKFSAHCLKNGWRYRLSYRGAPIGNRTSDMIWTHVRRSHVTLNGQGFVQDTLGGCKYPENNYQVDRVVIWKDHQQHLWSHPKC